MVMSEEAKRDNNATADLSGDEVSGAEAHGEATAQTSEATKADAETQSGENAGDAAPDDELPADGPVELSREEYDAFQQQIAERDRLRDELLRVRADFENYQKRTRRERPGIEDQAVRGLIADLLPVVDNFERALDVKDDATASAILEGVRMIHRMFLDVLSTNGADPIEADGQPFNPEFHEAVHQLPVEDRDQDGTVVEVVQKGYTHKQAVVRASKVVCGKFSGTPPESDAPSEDEAGEVKESGTD